MSAGPEDNAPIVTGLLRAGDRILLCHRSPQRRWYPDVWDLPGGHIEPGESPAAALARELHEELGITVTPPPAPPLRIFRGPTFTMRIWLLDTWTGTPANTAPEEHDAIGWFTAPELPALTMADDSYLEMFREVLSRSA